VCFGVQMAAKGNENAEKTMILIQTAPGEF